MVTILHPSAHHDYGAGQIQVLEGLEPVRRCPDMYIGNTGVEGLHHLAWEVLDNAVDKAMSGHACLISLCLKNDGSCTVSDDGCPRDSPGW